MASCDVVQYIRRQENKENTDNAKWRHINTVALHYIRVYAGRRSAQRLVCERCLLVDSARAPPTAQGG
jgi:hypothetical protein